MEMRDKVTTSNIAYALYHLEQMDCPKECNYEELIHNDLSELDEQLHSKLSDEEAESLFTRIIDYGEHKAEKYFEEGMVVGLKLYKKLLCL